MLLSLNAGGATYLISVGFVCINLQQHVNVRFYFILPVHCRVAAEFSLWFQQVFEQSLTPAKKVITLLTLLPILDQLLPDRECTVCSIHSGSATILYMKKTKFHNG